MTESNAAGDAFNDSLNFVKKLWGQMGVPGMAPQGMTMPGMPSMAPSMSVEDLDKRIQELKTVETWLNVNMQMLRGTIQALEVQRATIATLHSLSTSMANSMNPVAAAASVAADKSDSGANSAEAVSPLIAQSAAWWQGVQEQFKHALGTALEKSAANFEAARSASEDIVSAATVKTPAKASRPAAKPKTAAKAKAKPRASASRTRKAL